MTNRKIEFTAGLFVCIGLAAVLYLTLTIGGARWFKRDSYELHAQFSNSAGVTTGSRLKLPGCASARLSASS